VPCLLKAKQIELTVRPWQGDRLQEPQTEVVRIGLGTSPWALRVEALAAQAGVRKGAWAGAVAAPARDAVTSRATKSSSMERILIPVSFGTR